MLVDIFMFTASYLSPPKIHLPYSLSPVLLDRVVQITKSVYPLSMCNKLKQYLEENGLSQREFGERIGVRQSVVSRWVSGKAYPDWECSLPRIIKATGGKVDANSFVEDLDD